MLESARERVRSFLDDIVFKAADRLDYIRKDDPIAFTDHARSRHRSRLNRDLWRDHYRILKGDEDAELYDSDHDNHVLVFEDETDDGLAIFFPYVENDGTLLVVTCFAKSAKYAYESDQYERIA